MRTAQWTVFSLARVARLGGQMSIELRERDADRFRTGLASMEARIDSGRGVLGSGWLNYALFGLAVLFGANCAFSQGQVSALDKASVNLVRVTLTVNGIQVSPDRIAPGKIQLWVENKTAIAMPKLLIASVKTVAQREETKAKALVQVNSKGRRSWIEVSLSPGTYVISLANAPEVQSRIVVAPKN